jgi:hypothetical protein
MISELEIHNILKDFPKIKLSYETFVHKKVYNADIIFAIPEGKKCFAWFTTYKQNNTCFLLEVGINNQITNVNICITSFTDVLSYGTILYGSIFKHNNNICFSVENIFYFRGKCLEKTSFENKLIILHSFFTKNISQFAISNKFVIFGLPIFAKKNDFSKLLNEIETLPYKISSLQFHHLNDNTGQLLVMKYYKPGSQYQNNSSYKKKQAVFKIMPDIQNDIYFLHIYNNGNYEYYDIAYIPDYKTSVLMNKLFRNIKENTNLDLLEESDDESEFENNKADKFVYLDKSFKMNCVYNHKFKKWVPISIASKNDKVTQKNQLF